MIRTVLWLLFAGFWIFITMPMLFVCRLIQGKDKLAPVPKIADDVLKIALPPVLKLGGCDYEVRGKDKIPDEVCYFVGNHQSNVDIVILMNELHPAPSFIAKIELSRIPVVASWMKMLHVIFMDRKDLRQSLQCIKDQQEQLAHGYNGLIFPEGTRSRGPQMAEFKAGSFKAPIKAKVPIVPFAIDGTYKVFEEHGQLRKAKCVISFLDPIDTDGTEKTADLAAEVQARIQAELDSIRSEAAYR